eukprot:XP_013985279.1 PREDICTED: FRAS1-related extracellular matrix protein 2-like [Salmo salar]
MIYIFYTKNCLPLLGGDKVFYTKNCLPLLGGGNVFYTKNCLPLLGGGNVFYTKNCLPLLGGGNVFYTKNCLPLLGGGNVFYTKNCLPLLGGGNVFYTKNCLPLLGGGNVFYTKNCLPLLGAAVSMEACNPKYPDYDKTGSICVSEHINNTMTRYRWLVSAPAGPDGVTTPMREVDFDTFFTSSKIITLDSVYFQSEGRTALALQQHVYTLCLCGVWSLEEEQQWLCSSMCTRCVCVESGVWRKNSSGSGEACVHAVSVWSLEEEQQWPWSSMCMCQPRKVGTVGAGPFSAKLRYTGTEDPDHPNLIKLTVTVPHIDGMLPVISTRPLSNMELTLSPDGTRVGNHLCSNLLDYSEVTTGHGFITAESVGDTSPYQYSTPMRGDNTLRFYKNLNLEACLWGFTSYYNMSELLTDCGGTIRTDGQPLISG